MPETCSRKRRRTNSFSPTSAVDYAAIGQEKRALPLLAQAAALGADTPEVLYEVAVGYEMLHHRDEALRWLAKQTTVVERLQGRPSHATRGSPRSGPTRATSRPPTIPPKRR